MDSTISESFNNFSAFTSINNVDSFAGLMENGELSSFHWIVNHHALIGNLVLFYFDSPISAIVATAQVSNIPILVSESESEWFGKYAAEMSKFNLLAEPISQQDLIKFIPDWVYWKKPLNSVPVPERFLNIVDDLLFHRSLILQITDKYFDPSKLLRKNH
ncbi:MAG TPA: hypothetical protein PKY82_02360 [Pyrinomonadaceae bacterium]|nr:hypothetical protein [Pyrinomonadaceae bacterium]